MAFLITKNQRGYSLTEIMIAVGIASIVVLGVGELVTQFVRSSAAVTDTIDSDEEALRLQYFFSLPLRTAVKVKRAASSIDSYNIPVPPAANAFEGVVYDTFDSNSLPQSSSTTSAIMIFEHDTSALTAAGGTSNFEPVGIYFQQPSPTSYGILYVSNADSAGTIVPKRGGMTITNVTRVQLSQVGTGGAVGSYVQSFMVKVWLRYPTTANGVPPSWCGIDDVTGLNKCGPGGGPSKDTVHTFTVNLSNNIPASMGMTSGRVYFLGRGNLP